MICKFCNKEFDAESYVFCPFCGRNINEEGQQSCERNYVGPDLDLQTPERPGNKKKPATLILCIVGAVAALALLAAALLYAMGINPIAYVREELAKNGTILVKDSYTVSDEKMEARADKVVATVGDHELTNEQLNIYYRLQVYDFIKYYGSYLTYVGLDTATALNEQTCGLDETKNWEQYFVEVAIQTWQNYQTMAMMGQEAGYTLSEKTQAELDNLSVQLEEQAASDGYDSAQAMIQDLFGTNCTLEAYIEYVKLNVYANEYYTQESSRLTPTDEDAKTYFAENEATFAESNITRDGGMISDVRHILISIEGGTTDEEGNTVYTEEEKAAAYAKAEALLAQWKAGEATEESFTALAIEHSQDGGVVENEGLYTGVYPGAGYVEGFLNWSVDMSRQPGDTDIVETEFGYHIMYYVQGEPYWLNVARTNLLSERTTELLKEGTEKWAIDIDYKKIAVAELSLA